MVCIFNEIWMKYTVSCTNFVWCILWWVTKFKIWISKLNILAIYIHLFLIIFPFCVLAYVSMILSTVFCFVSTHTLCRSSKAFSPPESTFVHPKGIWKLVDNTFDSVVETFQLRLVGHCALALYNPTPFNLVQPIVLTRSTPNSYEGSFFFHPYPCVCAEISSLISLVNVKISRLYI